MGWLAPCYKPKSLIVRWRASISELLHRHGHLALAKDCIQQWADLHKLIKRGTGKESVVICVHVIAFNLLGHGNLL